MALVEDISPYCWSLKEKFKTQDAPWVCGFCQIPVIFFARKMQKIRGTSFSNVKK
jgi:hypothetical protein